MKILGNPTEQQKTPVSWLSIGKKQVKPLSITVRKFGVDALTKLFNKTCSTWTPTLSLMVSNKNLWDFSGAIGPIDCRAILLSWAV